MLISGLNLWPLLSSSLFFSLFPRISWCFWRENTRTRSRELAGCRPAGKCQRAAEETRLTCSVRMTCSSTSAGWSATCTLCTWWETSSRWPEWPIQVLLLLFYGEEFSLILNTPSLSKVLHYSPACERKEGEQTDETSRTYQQFQGEFPDST